MLRIYIHGNTYWMEKMVKMMLMMMMKTKRSRREIFIRLKFASGNSNDGSFCCFHQICRWCNVLDVMSILMGTEIKRKNSRSWNSHMLNEINCMKMQNFCACILFLCSVLMHQFFFSCMYFIYRLHALSHCLLWLSLQLLYTYLFI